MSMFTGEYRHSLDLKNRLIIPSKFRNNLGENIVITRGLDGCLFCYSCEEWQKILEKMNGLAWTRSDSRKFTRFLTSGATTLEFDKQGRVVRPSYLKDFASIEKDVVLIGVLNRIEIWSSSKWDEFMQSNIDSLSDISENLFSSSLEL